MKRICIKFPLNKFSKEVNVFQQIKVDIFVDLHNYNSILSVITNRKSKFKRIVYTVLSGKYNNDLYAKENVSGKAKYVTAMKFKKGDNERIYCKEFYESGKKVVMIIAVAKKSQKITVKLKNLLETIGDYDYEFN
jgi:hypothetical protein